MPPRSARRGGTARVEKETDVENYVCAVCRHELGAEVAPKFRPAPPGWPDRVIAFPGGVVWWLEFKRASGGRDQACQPVIRAALEKLGHSYVKLTGRKEADEWLASMKHSLATKKNKITRK